MRITKFISILLIIMFAGLTSTQAQSFSSSYKFLKSIKEANYREIKMAVEKGVNVNTRDFDDQTTALIKVTKQKDAALVQYLLKNGAKPNYVGKDGKTPLVLAAASGEKTIVAILIRYKAKLDRGDKNGMTPLIAAIVSRKTSIVKLLLDAGADYMMQDNSGRTALDHILEGRKDSRARQIKKLLIKAGASE